jgi:hypothetical protein
MQLSFNGTEIIGRQIRIDLADNATGQPYPILMNEDGSYTHRYEGHNAFMTALENFEDFTTVKGKPIREVWLSLLKDHLATVFD